MRNLIISILFFIPSILFAQCNLSQIGESVRDAAVNSRQFNSTIDLDNTFSSRNSHVLTEVSPRIFPAFGIEMLKANHEIDIQTFLFSESDAVNSSLGALKNLESRLATENRFGNPVLVRFSLNVLDVSANHDNARTKIEGMVEGLAEFKLDPSLIAIEIATHIHTFVGSNHSKSGIIDGKIFFIGGANFDDTNDFNNPAFDSAYAFKGASVKTMLEDFDRTWELSTLWNCTVKNGSATCLEGNNGIASHVDGVINAPNEAPENSCLPAIVMTRKAKNFFNNDNNNAATRGFVAAMNAATQHINIFTPNMNDDEALNAILNAAERGVLVHILLSFGYEDFAQSLPFQGGTNANVVRDLFMMASPKQLAHLSIRWYSSDGSNVVLGNATNASHLKYMSVDNAFHIVGSSNFDTQSWNHSSETNIGLDDRPLTLNNDNFVFWPAFNRAIPAISFPLPPKADAGGNQTARAGRTLTISATDSKDLYGNIISYQWEQVNGTVTQLTNADRAKVKLTIPSAGSVSPIRLKLTVTNSNGVTDIDFMQITVL